MVVAIAVAHGTAAAQVVPGRMIEEPKMAAGASLTVWLPSGDADDFSDTSLGVRPHFTYRVMPWLAVLGTFDFVFVNEQDGVGDITYYSIGGGARFVLPRPGRFEPYGELVLGWHSIDGEGFEETDLGFRLGGGVLYPMSERLLVNFAANYSTVSFDSGFIGDIDVDALILEVGLATRF